MVFEELLALLGREPVFETGFLLAGDTRPGYTRRQLAQWVKTGKLWQLRRGLYMPAPPYQRVVAHPFALANRLVPGSYVSLHAALAYYDLIPEYVAAVTSVSADRPGRWSTPVGEFIYHHVQPTLLFGYRALSVSEEQSAFVATSEKALLDLVYLHARADVAAYVAALRLQNLAMLDLDALQAMAERFAKPKMRRAAAAIAALAHEDDGSEPL
jgi:predicted transcriptional regulator of viral defense system